MAKRKHPTWKSIRQGQTVYIANFHIERDEFPLTADVKRYQVVSDKVIIQPGTISPFINIGRIRMILKDYETATKAIFYVRGACEKHIRDFLRRFNNVPS